jgi:hypothetical protein
MRFNYLLLRLFIAPLFFSNLCSGQTAFKTIDTLKINKISAAVSVHGDLWRDTGNSNFSRFPYADTVSVAYRGNLWFAGFDTAGTLHVAAQAFRQTGIDYWPGPLDASDTLTYTNSQKWARIWKVDYNDINTFLAITTHTVSNTPKAILEWPAKGNINAKGAGGASLSITNDMAPFVDVDHDGSYNPLNGDYPLLKGDQMLWWVFSDNGPTHSETNGKALKIEIHAMAYAYDRSGILENIQYYEYHIINKGADYHNFRIGLFADLDNGSAYNDYIGYDSARRMGYNYNATSPDTVRNYWGRLYGYGYSSPIVGTSVIEMPGDSSLPLPAGSFMYYNNDFTINGNPVTDTDYYRYLNATWRNGVHLKNDFKGRGIHSDGIDSTAPVCNYVFTGDPKDTNQWSECNCNNIPYDRRYIIATTDYNFRSGQEYVFAFALVVTDTSSSNFCPLSLDSLKSITDSSWYYYRSPLMLHPAAVNELNHIAGNIKIYPNPANANFTLNLTQKEGTYCLYNLMGQKMLGGNLKKGNNIINVEALPVGMYALRIEAEGMITTQKLVIAR